MFPADELIFLPLGGSGEIGMNVNLYGCQGQWVMVDMGMTFADPYFPGVELILPDLRFIEEQRDKLLGIVLTHGHEDHIGAIPYLAADFDVPLYATPFTAGLIREKLAQEGLSGRVKVKEVPLGGTVNLGPFALRYVPLAHSIAEGNGLVIDTPHGRVFHTGDWKLDDDPLLGTPSSAEDLMAIGDEGVLAVVGDSTNVFNLTASGSEGAVRDALIDLVMARKTGRVVITTFASNAARVATLGAVAAATGRSLVVAGRSLHRIIKVAQESGYLDDLPPVIDAEDAQDLPASQVLIACTGCQGEPQAALSRIATGQHRQIKLTKGDVVVFSSKKIPGNELSIGRVHNELVTRGVEVITEKEAPIHVSGHPGQPELKALYAWLRPDILVPVHGEVRHMTEHARLGKQWGIPHQVVPINGTVIRLAPGDPAIIDRVETGRLVLDGDVIVPADGETMMQRRRLLNHGYLAVSFALGKSGKMASEVQVIVQGVPLEDEAEAFRAECAELVARTVARGGKDRAQLTEQVRIAIRKLAREYTGKKPVAEVFILSV